MSGMYKEFKNQMNKLDNSQNLNITVMYDKYILRKEQISTNLLMITICDTPNLNMGALDRLVGHFKTNFAAIDEHIQKVTEQTD